MIGHGCLYWQDKQGGSTDMPFRVNNNISALNARRVLNANNRNLGIRLERLASGLRVNRASDDAAGLAVRELSLIHI